MGRLGEEDVQIRLLSNVVGVLSISDRLVQPIITKVNQRNVLLEGILRNISLSVKRYKFLCPQI